MMLGIASKNIFATKWAESFSHCSSLSQLEELLGRCTEEWIEAVGVTDVGESEEPARAPTSNRPVPARRVQSRQQQRARRRRKNDARAASRLQRLFNVYPRRAVREALGESSLPFDGDQQQAKAYLESTYNRARPDEELVQEARRTYDDCNWEHPSEEETTLLALPPKRMEILRKLQHSTNTAPGSDGIEYRHIKRLDPSCSLLESLYSSVWKLGIPKQWKESKTVFIYKKGDTKDISNFRPISLLSTLYKIFSGVLCSRLVATAVRNHWLSPEQKGFLPGVKGLQEHTQVLQMVVGDVCGSRERLWLTPAHQPRRAV